MVPYNEAKRLIMTAVFEHDVIVYIKGNIHEKRTWLWNLLLNDERERIYIETLDAVYENMESLTNLDVANTMRCGQYVKNCALQNVLKIYNWWLQKNFLNKKYFNTYLLHISFFPSFIYMCVFICMNVYVCMYVCMCICMYVYMYNMYVWMNVYIYGRICMNNLYV